jgi:Ca2+-binding RTX toxin-like protein
MDLVKASVDSTLGAHVENLKLTGTASIDGTGNELANTITGNAASNTLSGGAGDDKLLGNDGDDALFGGSGNDVLAGGNGGDALYGGTGKDAVYAGDGGDKAHGGSGDDRLYGGAGNDALSGGSGRDALYGGAGRDKLSGGAGADKLHGGGGADMFIFTPLKDSTVAAAGRDTIFDFSRKEGDRIDLKGIDASTTAGGNQAFSFIGADTFSKTAGELRYERKDGGTYVYGDVNGDGKADFSIRIDSAIDFTKADFLL